MYLGASVRRAEIDWRIPALRRHDRAAKPTQSGRKWRLCDPLETFALKYVAGLQLWQQGLERVGHRRATGGREQRDEQSTDAVLAANGVKSEWEVAGEGAKRGWWEGQGGEARGIA